MVVVDVVDDLVFPGRVHIMSSAHRLVIASQLVDGILEGQPVCGFEVFVYFIPQALFFCVFLLSESKETQADEYGQ